MSKKNPYSNVEKVKVTVAWKPTTEQVIKLDSATICDLEKEGKIRLGSGFIKKDFVFNIYEDEKPKNPSLRLKKIIIDRFLGYLFKEGGFQTTAEEYRSILSAINQEMNEQYSDVVVPRTDQDFFSQIFEDGKWTFSVTD